MFLLTFWNFQLRVGQERNVMIIFIFSLSHPFPTYFRFKRSHNGIFLVFRTFLEFSISRRVGTKQNDTFYILSFPAFYIRFWLDMKAIVVFFNFLNVFVNFLEFSITRRAGTKRNDNFYLYSF